MKTLLLAFVIAMGTMSFNAEKAEAGLIVTIIGSGAAGTGVVPGAILIGAGSFIGVIGAATMNNGPVPRKVSTALAIAGLSLFVVDAEEAQSLEAQLPSIPSYVFDTIETAAQLKVEEGKRLSENVVEVVLSNDEADEILSLADGADQVEIQILKDALTTSTL